MSYEPSSKPKSDWTSYLTPSVLLWVLKVVLTSVLLIGPPVYLAIKPEHFTPLVDTMLSGFLFLLAFWIGRDLDIAKAKQEASDRWLPQAEAVTYRLLTLFSNVRGFADKMHRTCGETSCELPELKTDELKSVRIKLKSDCESSSARLNDIANQLEDAIGDWQRFIAANCQGQECARIFEAFDERWERVKNENALSAQSNPEQQS